MLCRPVGGEFVVLGNSPLRCRLARAGRHATVRPTRELLILAIHLLVTFAKVLRPGGVPAVAAESLLLKHQLLISNRSRQRAESDHARSLRARSEHASQISVHASLNSRRGPRGRSFPRSP